MSTLARIEDYPPGEYGLPHMGAVIADHRIKAGWTSQEAFAIVCGVDKQTVVYWENQKYLADMKRRIFLCRLLRIPPVLLGLTWPSVLNDGEVPQYIKDSESMVELLSANSYGLYEDILTFASINPQRYTREAAYRFYQHQKELEKLVITVPALEKDNWLDLLARYYQHSTFIAEHHAQSDLALSYADKALHIAISMDPQDAELTGSSHYKRARLYLTRGNRNLAKEDIQAVLEKAEHVGIPLRGSTYLLAAEINALDASQDGKLRTQCRSWQDNAADLLYNKKKVESDGTFILFDLYAVHHERAKILMRFALFHTTDEELIEGLKNEHRRADAGLLKEAHSALSSARKHLEAANGTRPTRIMDSTITEARLLLMGKEYEESAKLVKTALTIARLINSAKGINEVEKIYTMLHQLAPKNPYVCNLGVELGKF